MDSVSQFALGAAVGVAVMGRRTAAWKAAAWGGVLGTLPDLDALIDHGNPVLNMVLHRAETHALFWQTLAAPVIAAGIAWMTAPRAARHSGADTGLAAADARVPAPSRWRDAPHWLLTVWLAFVTHAFLDAMTVYGTQLALPFSNLPYGVGSIFIIDPLYTLPLLAGLAVTLATRRPGRWRWNLAGLALSTAYLAWSAVAQQVVTSQVAPQIKGPGLVLVTPTPFNTVLWRVLVMHEDRYEEGFYSLLDGGRAVRFTAYPLDQALAAEARHIEAAQRIAAFSRGFHRIDEREGTVRITDLRMGQEPAYVFSFAVAQRGSPLQPIVPQSVGGRDNIDVPAALRWLWRRAAGEDIDPPR